MFKTLVTLVVVASCTLSATAECQRGDLFDRINGEPCDQEDSRGAPGITSQDGNFLFKADKFTFQCQTCEDQKKVTEISSKACRGEFVEWDQDKGCRPKDGIFYTNPDDGQQLTLEGVSVADFVTSANAEQKLNLTKMFAQKQDFTDFSVKINAQLDGTVADVSQKVNGLLASRREFAQNISTQYIEYFDENGFEPVGAYAKFAGASCKAIKAAGFHQGSKRYWVGPSQNKAELVYCNMTGEGAATGDGSNKDQSAMSCNDIDEHFGTYSPGVFWIGGSKLVCGYDQSGHATQVNDGSTKALSAPSCQSMLDFYKIKNNWKGFVNGDEVICTVKDGKATLQVAGKSKANPALSCMAIKDSKQTETSGNFWVKRDGWSAAQLVYCDVKKGRTLIFNSHVKHRSKTEWALSFDVTTKKGKNTADGWDKEENYLLPIELWRPFNGGDLIQYSKDKPYDYVMTDFVIGTEGSKYTINWKNNHHETKPQGVRKTNWPDSGYGPPNYHKGAKLSTVDQDNDVYGGSCANGGGTFGWYKACCSMCMTTYSNGGWDRWSRNLPYAPSDWSYRYTTQYTWWMST